MTKVAADGLAQCGWLNAAPLQELLRVLGGARGEARIAGGAVRNALLGEPVADVDIATVHAPAETTQRCTKAGFSVHPTGIDHGTVTVVSHAGDKTSSYEVTTLRVDTQTFGRRAEVAFTDDWQADAARRDFTINALYCDADGTIFDPLGGLADITGRRVRFVGEARCRIAEDYLRILRFFRFHARYGEGEPDSDGLAACIALREGLQQLSAERVRAELFKIFTAPGATATVAAMEAAGVLAIVLPRGRDAERFARMVRIDEDNGFAADPVLRLAALAGTAPGLASALRLSNEEAGRLAGLDAGRGLTPDLAEAERKRMLYRLGTAAFRDAVRFWWSGDGDDGDWRALYDLADDWPVPVFPISGADLLQRGLAPGPQLGDQLRALEDWWIAAGYPDDKAAILAQLPGERDGPDAKATDR